MSNKEVLQKANAAIAEGNKEGFLAYCTDDTEWDFIGDKILRGKEAVRQWMAKEYITPPDFTVHHLVAEGDYVTAVGTITSKDEEGNIVHYAYCDVWRFRKGKLAGLKAFVIKNQSV